MDELEALRAELEHYKSQKTKIRGVIGQLGGKSSARREKVLNISFLAIVLAFFLFDIVRHLLGLHWPFLPPSLLLEIAVLLVSIKIIWMIHKSAKVEHFQFWILNSIEFQLNMIARRIGNMENGLKSLRPRVPAYPATYPSEEDEAD